MAVTRGGEVLPVRNGGSSPSGDERDAGRGSDFDPESSVVQRSCGEVQMSSGVDREADVLEADHVVVGSGSGGSPVIRRLLDEGRSVIVLEAGGEDDHEAITAPDRMFELRGTELDHAFRTEPQASLGGRRVEWPRGRVLGGSSAINGMIHMRGHREDFDSWARGGADGWSYHDVLPILRRLERLDPAGDPAYRGHEGPLPVRFNLDLHPLSAAQVQAARQAGFPFNADPNAEDPYGVSHVQLNIADGRRVSAWRAYLGSAREHERLTVLPGASAIRVLLERGKAVGVEYVRRGERRVARARGEIVLSAGALGTPHVLQLSGIGPADALRRVGITPVVDLPGVGENLHDHILSQVVWRSRRPIDASGHAPFEVQLFADSRAGLARPDLQPVTGFSAYPMPGYVFPEGRVYSWYPGVVRPRSRGRLWLRSADPMEQPLVDPAYLREQDDLDALVEGIQITREIGRQAALAEWNAEEIAPGPDVRTRAELDAYARASLNTYYHPVGTARMGTDPLAVVDPRLRVYGVTGLRVADASIFPEIPSANTHVAAVMVGERAADFIAADS
ncbi:GMC family oxidoreductase [Gulosibacter sp. 10]|uniref:GMC family oxidoreductase n=1 Tax=Gulosibacter sp. 10 TaxID=1255570 RepID=UPI001C3D9059|nr:GMC family oxidoreductase N-terminal domain-containing protein [Gulosibacter sp. 10]